jgi:phosphoglycolate phosphatase-like HAD superfamily hydrolase
VADAAIIFDVDGVLLDLTRHEEEIFFAALSKFVPTENLSRDWNSYKIRNDEDIIIEILDRNQLPASLKLEVIEQYISVLKKSTIKSVPIAGAASLLQTLHGKAQLGIATANLLRAAKHRLEQTDLWSLVADHAHGAEGGGHKSVILQRCIQHMNVPLHRIVYVGDNRNDVEAGVQQGVHFIGFSIDPERCAQLRLYGAQHVCQNHLETFELIKQLLA